MVRYTTLLVILFTTIGLLATAPSAAEEASVLLTDGTTLRGEVLSLKGGTYQIQTRSLGTLSIPQNDVRVVEYGAATSSSLSPSPAQAPPDSAQMQGILSKLQNSPGLIAMVQSLAQDADMQRVLQDPEIQRAIAAGDYSSLMANPKMQRLMGNQKIQAITQQLK
jgi:hypothetical protein